MLIVSNFLQINLRALFDQVDTLWNDQVLQMGQWVQIGSLNIHFLPEQISVMNPILVMIIIPIVYKGILPFFERLNRPIRPLTRMVVGMLLTSVAFVIVGLLQITINAKPEALEFLDGGLVCKEDGRNPDCLHVVCIFIHKDENSSVLTTKIRGGNLFLILS